MITIIVPTHNRAEYLADCLRSIADQKTTLSDWAVIVVDSASTDRTHEVAKSMSAHHARISYLFEPVPGASRARNVGLAAARSPYVLYIDDDSICPPGYLDVAHRLIEMGSPVCFGGPIRAHCAPELRAPRWFKEEYGSFSAPHHNLPGELPSLSGGNLGCAREALQQIGGFDERYGPVGRRMRYGEDTLVVAQLASQFGAARICFDDTLINYHSVHPEDFSWPHIMMENFLRGYARGHLSHEACMRDVVSRLSGRTNGGLRSIAARACEDLLLTATRSDPKRFPHAQNVIYERWMGYVRQIGVLLGRAAAWIGRLSTFPFARRVGIG